MAVDTFEAEPRLVHSVCLPGAPSVTVRPASPGDCDVIRSYIRQLSAGSRHNRFLGTLKELSPRELHRMTHADHWHRLAMIAETVVAGTCVMIGEAYYVMAPDQISCDIALSVADAWQRRTLGTRLMGILAARARSVGISYLTGEVLRSNAAMTALARKSGWAVTAAVTDARLIRMTKQL
jgi:GNAT superfamily N-acetyltransferase